MLIICALYKIDPDLVRFFAILILSLSGFLFSNIIAKQKFLKSSGMIFPVLIQRISGALIFLSISLFSMMLFRKYDLTEMGLSAPGRNSFIAALIAGIIILPVNYFNSRTKENLEIYPQIRISDWTYSLVFISALSWIIYLTGYELLIRGVLLSLSIPLIGLWPAIGLNTIIYFIIHLQKGIREATGAIPFGIILCYLTFITGSIWFALFTHVILALSNEWLSVYFHPVINVRRNIK